MDVFSLFAATPYMFLQLEDSQSGYEVVSETETTGIIKYRDGMTQEGNREAHTSQTILTIRPDEPFISTVGGHLGLVGHGIRAGGDDYRIDGVVAGSDDDTGLIEFYRLTLKKGATWQSQASRFPRA